MKLTPRQEQERERAYSIAASKIPSPASLWYAISELLKRADESASAIAARKFDNNDAAVRQAVLITMSVSDLMKLAVHQQFQILPWDRHLADLYGQPNLPMPTDADLDARAVSSAANEAHTAAVAARRRARGRQAVKVAKVEKQAAKVAKARVKAVNHAERDA